MVVPLTHSIPFADGELAAAGRSNPWKREAVPDDPSAARRCSRRLKPAARAVLPDGRGSAVAARVHGTVRCLEGEGGDFLRVCRHEGHLGVTLGDVSGHGPSAAPYVEQFAETLSELDELRRNRRPWLARLNRRLCRQFHDDRFGAAVSVAIRLTPCTGELLATIANAGMPRPLLYRARENDVVEVGAVAPPLGVFDDDAHLPRPERIRMRAGDVLLVMSDGVAEALDCALPERGSTGRCAQFKPPTDQGAKVCGTGHWPVRAVQAAGGPRDREYEAASRPPAVRRPVGDMLSRLAPAGGRLVHDALARALERRFRRAPQRDDVSFAVVEIGRAAGAAAVSAA